MDGISHAEAAPGQSDRPAAAAPPPKRRRAIVVVAVIAVIAVLGVLAWRYLAAADHYETTDDAFIDGHIADVASQVSGRVATIAVDDNQHVTAGQVLVQIDPRDLQVRLQQQIAQRADKDAKVAQKQAQIGIEQANIDQAIANARVAEADLTQARQDLARFRGIDPAAITRQQLDTASSTAGAAQARLDASRQAIAAARAQLAASQADLASAIAQRDAADADIANARLQLSYATVTAPVSGTAAKRSVELGNYITPGAALMAIVPDTVWVTANFKETQTGRMHAGQNVDVTIDQYPGLKLHGHVDSFQSGTGVVFSAIPAENATGNYVKVVQRVPVKIILDPPPADAPADLRLSPGLSVSPRVQVR